MSSQVPKSDRGSLKGFVSISEKEKLKGSVSNLLLDVLFYFGFSFDWKNKIKEGME